MSRKITGLWESFRKDFKYLESQSELLSASMASYSSSKLALIQSQSKSSKKFTSTEKIEFEFHFHSNNSQYILDKMKETVESLERTKESIITCFINEAILYTALVTSFTEIFKNLNDQIESFLECRNALLVQPLLSQTSTKSILALVIHKPLIAWQGLLSDVESLILIKTGASV